MHSTNSIWIFDLYFLLFKTIKSDIKTVQKIDNNLINENIFPLQISSLRNAGDLCEYPIYVKHIS